MTYRIEKWNTKGESKCVGDYGGGYTEQDVKDLIKGYKKTETIGNMQFYQRKGSYNLYVVVVDQK